MVEVWLKALVCNPSCKYIPIFGKKTLVKQLGI